MTTDGAGNAFTSALITVTVDNTAPILSVAAPNPVNLATADPAAVSATATDAGSGIANVRFEQCAEDSPPAPPTRGCRSASTRPRPTPASWPIPSDGPRLLRVRATDNAGKQKTELVLVTIDRTAADRLADGARRRREPARRRRRARGDGVRRRPGRRQHRHLPALARPARARGPTSRRDSVGAVHRHARHDRARRRPLRPARLHDRCGRQREAAPATIQVRVDNTLPTGTVTAPAPARTSAARSRSPATRPTRGSGVATVQFQRSPAGAGTWTNQAASFDTTAVADGHYDLRVVTTDNAGNAFTSAAITIRVDNTLPTGSVTAPGRRRERPRHDRARQRLGRRRLRRRDRPVPALPGRRRHLDEPGRELDTTTVADGQYDLRVTTTDNAGNAFTSAAITIRVDNTAPDRQRHRARERRRDRRAAGGADEQLGRRRRLGRRHGRLRAQPGRRRHLDGDGRELEHRERPGCGRRRQLRPARDDDRQRRQLFTSRRDHGARRPHRADDLRVARPGHAEQRAGHRHLLGERRLRLRRQRHLLPRRRRQPPARHLGRSSPPPATTRTTARTWSSSSRPTTSATSRRRRPSRS